MTNQGWWRNIDTTRRGQKKSNDRSLNILKLITIFWNLYVNWKLMFFELHKIKALKILDKRLGIFAIIQSWPSLVVFSIIITFSLDNIVYLVPFFSSLSGYFKSQEFNECLFTFLRYYLRIAPNYQTSVKSTNPYNQNTNNWKCTSL